MTWAWCSLAVARVSADAWAAGVGAGSATITATIEGRSSLRRHDRAAGAQPPSGFTGLLTDTTRIIPVGYATTGVK